MPNIEYNWKYYTQKLYLQYNEVTGEYDAYTTEENDAIARGLGAKDMATTWYWECKRCGDRIEVSPHKLWTGGAISTYTEPEQRKFYYEEIVIVDEAGAYFSTWIAQRTCEAKVGPRKVCYGIMTIHTYDKPGGE